MLVLLSDPLVECGVDLDGLGAMEDLLYLVHRIPYPPNKGDKIRSYHFLKILLQNYRVHLGAFIDDPQDIVHHEYLADLCESVHFVSINPMQRRLWSLTGLLTGQALSLPYYQHRKMKQWVREVLEQYEIHKALVFSSTMAQYVIDQPELPCLIDFVDVDSDKWRQYAERKNGVSGYIYQREADKLLQYERHAADQSCRSFFVSEREAALFKQLAPESADKVGFINNGVDTEYFSPAHDFQSPYGGEGPVIVFTGAMDYWANVDAVLWFAQEIFPAVRQQLASACFYVVGSKPTKQVQELALLNSVRVTGRVDDIRPYLAHADLVIAPLRVARGVQNKVLEGLAMDRPVLATEAAMEGIEVNHSLNLHVAENPDAFALATVDLLNQPGIQKKGINRQFVSDHFSWESSGNKLLNALSL